MALLMLSAGALSAQENTPMTIGEESAPPTITDTTADDDLLSAAEGAQAGALATEELSRGFGAITLGSSLDETIDELRASQFFIFNEDQDISRIPNSTNALITVAGEIHIESAFFQFDQERLISIQFILDTAIIDHFSIYTFLQNKYGEPQELNPTIIAWESESVRLSLEKPLIIKYIDLQFFTSQREERTIQRSEREERINAFLEEL